MYPQPPPSRAPFFIAGALVAAAIGAGVWWYSPATPPGAKPAAATTKTSRAQPDVGGAASTKESGGGAGAAPRPIDFPLQGPITLEMARQYFLTWGGYCIWEDNYTEFAMWSPETQDYTTYFGVRFVNGDYRIEKLSRLTRPLLDHGVPTTSPLAFTEPEAMRDEFHRTHPDYKPTRPRWGEHVPALPPRPPRPPAASQHGPTGTLNPPNPSSSPATPRVNEPLTSTLGARTVVVRLQEFLQRGNLPGIDVQAADLVALLQLAGVDPVLPDISGPALDRAIAARKHALETVPASATAFLSETQLAALRGLLQMDINQLEARRDAGLIPVSLSRDVQILPPLDQQQPVISPPPR